MWQVVKPILTTTTPQRPWRGRRIQGESQPLAGDYKFAARFSVDDERHGRIAIQIPTVSFEMMMPGHSPLLVRRGWWLEITEVMFDPSAVSDANGDGLNFTIRVKPQFLC